MEWLVACIPIFAFGFIPVLGTVLGGRPVEQSMGIALGGLVFAVAVWIFERPELDGHIFLVGALSGTGWAIGSVGQFMGLRYLGVSRSMPVSDGGQVVGTSLLGVALGEWATRASRFYGFGALVLIVTGIVLASYADRRGGSRPRWGRGLAVNLFSILGFTFYAGILKYYGISGWSSVLPQSVGQLAALSVISLVFFRVRPFDRASLRNGLTGLIWGVGNIALLLSQSRLGLAVAYPVSQAAVIVSVLGGVFINKEHKNRREWLFAAAGMAAICAGLVSIYFSAAEDIRP